MITDAQLVDKMAEFYADPLGFVLFAFPWGEKGTPLENYPDGPDEWQRDLFAAMSRTILRNVARTREDVQADKEIFRAAVASGHGIGKSACVAWIILWFMSCRPWCRGAVTANTADQLQTKTWPELAKWHAMAINKHWFQWTATQFYYKLCPEEKRGLYRFDAATWSEERMEGFQGLHNASSSVCVIMDEASGLPDKLFEVADFALTDGEAFEFAFGNPTRNTGRFREAFGRDRHMWWTRHVDSREVRITNKTYLNEIAAHYGEEDDYVKVRIRGLFPSMGDRQFIPSDVIAEARKRDLVIDPGAPLIVGVDVARYGEDRSVIAFRRGYDARSIPWRKFRALDTMQVAAEVIEAVQEHNPDFVFVDGVGVGGGVVDRLRLMGYKVIDVNVGNRADNAHRWANKRSEVWGELRDWLNRGGAIPDDQELADDLVAPEYKFTDKQSIMLERKEDMKKRGLSSPDVADALSLTFASKAPNRKLTLDRRNTLQRQARNHDYDVFNYERRDNLW